MGRAVSDKMMGIGQSAAIAEPSLSQKPRLQVCLLGLALEGGNRGVGALASGTISALMQTFPGARVCLLDYGKKPVNYEVRCHEGCVNVELINLRFSKKFYLRNNIARLLLTALLLRLIPVSSLRTRLILRSPYLRAISEMHLVASIAGGDSFSDIYGLARLTYISLPQLLVIALGKPLTLLPQTIGPFHTIVGRWLARLTLRRAKRIYTRDYESIKEVQTLVNGSGDVAFAHDMGFALEPFPPSPKTQDQIRQMRGRGLVGFNISGLLYRCSDTGNNQFGLKVDYRDVVQELISLLLEKLGLHVMLVPHSFGVRRNSESDNHASEAICQEFGSHSRLSLIQGPLDQHEVKWVIGQCDFFIGSRMHACIAAASQCVPAVGLAYSRKFAGVLNTIGGGTRVIDLRQASIDEVLKRVERAFTERKALHDELKARIPAIKDSVLNLFTHTEAATKA